MFNSTILGLGLTSKIFVRLILCFSLGGGLSITQAKIISTAEETIKKYYPGCSMKEENIFLTEEQSKEVELTYTQPLKTKLFNRRIIACKTAKHFIYLDSEIVRTQPQVIMITISDNDSLEKVDVLAFNEPEEYIPHRKWYETFDNKTNKHLMIDKDISHISGATLTTRSTITSVNKILALHPVWQKKYNAKK